MAKNKGNKILCPKCLDYNKENFLVDTGKVFMVYPQKRQYRCVECGYREIIVDKIKELETCEA